MSRVLSYLLLLFLVSVAVDTQAAPSDLRLIPSAQEDQQADSAVEKQGEDKKPADKEESAENKSEEKNDQKSDEKASEKNDDTENEEQDDASDDKEDDADEEDEDEEDDKDESDDAEGEDDEEDEKSKDDNQSKKKKDKKPEPHTVERKPIKIEEEVEGIFVAKEMHEVALRPESWSQYKVVEAVEHGAQVKKGDVLVRFDTEKIEKEIEEQSLSQRLSELTLMQQEEEFPRIKRQVEIEFEEAKKTYEQAQQDYQYYKEVDRPFDVEITNFLYKRALENLASQQEELDQLLKMYEADEITEETEEIVLRRQRFAVETAELMVKLQTASRDYSMNVSLPRRDERYETAMELAEIAFEQAKTAKEKGLTRMNYEMQQKREARASSIERHAKLVSDQGLMVIRAPADGMVYYGRCVNGKWAEVATYSAKLIPHGIVTPNKVLMTIVEQRPLVVNSALAEKEVVNFKEDQTAVISPTADEEVELVGKITKVSSIIGADKKFAMQLEVESDKAPDWLVAGMSCKANVTVYENKKALVVPIALVQTDEDDEKLKYVMLVEEDEDEPVRREIKLGRTKDKLVEVLKGLKEGDQIVKEEEKEEEE